MLRTFVNTVPNLTSLQEQSSLTTILQPSWSCINYNGEQKSNRFTETSIYISIE